MRLRPCGRDSSYLSAALSSAHFEQFPHALATFSESERWIWAWGDDRLGQIGDGRSIAGSHRIPGQVTSCPEVFLYRPGGEHSTVRAIPGYHDRMFELPGVASLADAIRTALDAV